MRPLRPLRVTTPASFDDAPPLGMAPADVRRLLVNVCLAAAVVALVGAAASFMAGRQTAASAQTVVAALPVDPEPPALSCLEAADEIAPIRAMLEDGDSALAASLARRRLDASGDLPLCASARADLASITYYAAIDAILSTPATDGGHEAYRRWMAAEAAATADGLPAEQRMSASSILSIAYGLGQWELSRGAFIAMWRAGQITPQDADALTKYVAILRNWGNLLLGRGASQQARAEQMLATAQAVADAAGLPIGEPCADLEATGVAHCRSVPPDYGDLILATLAGDDDVPPHVTQ